MRYVVVPGDNPDDGGLVWIVYDTATVSRSGNFIAREDAEALAARLNAAEARGTVFESIPGLGSNPLPKLNLPALPAWLWWAVAAGGVLILMGVLRGPAVVYARSRR